MGEDFNWISVVPTLVGAAVSIVTSVIVFSLTSWLETKRKIKVETAQSAILAFRGLRKLLAIANELGNLKRHIDQQFEEADQLGRSELQPYQKVRQIIGAETPLSPVTLDEAMFLSKLKLVHIIDEVELIYVRALNCRAISAKYNEFRAEMDDYLLNAASKLEVQDGTRATFEIDKPAHDRLELIGARLNNLLGELMQRLDEDLNTAKGLCELFMRSGHEFFGSDFPSSKLEWSGQ